MTKAGVIPISGQNRQTGETSSVDVQFGACDLAHVDHPEQRINVNRKVYDQYCFDAEFGYKPENRSDYQLLRRWFQKNCTFSSAWAKNWFFGRLPILRCLARYDLKNYMMADLVAGITVGIMHIPQGMAYALLAGLPPVYGMYTSFFPSLIYTFFGTSGHVSLGTIAVTSLLTGSVRYKFVPDNLNLLATDYNRTAYEEQLQQLVSLRGAAGTGNISAEHFQERIDPIPIITALTLLVGVFQVILGACHAGFMILYMSDQLVAGYTSGTAVIILSSQFEKLFGVKLEHRYEGTMAVYYTFRDVILALPKHINWITTAISGCCILTILIVKVCINDRYKKKMRIPVPIDLLVIIVVAVISHFCDLSKTQGVKIVNEVPTGIPLPQLPNLNYIPKLAPDAFITAIISYALSISMAQMFAKRHRYKIDANQELYAYGILNIIGSFFSAYPGAGSVSRSSVQESAGSKTQLTSAVAASLVLVVILWLGHLFEPLPMCVLSAVIVVALKSLFLQLLDTRRLWRKSKVDCTPASVLVKPFLIICDATLGLLISVVFAAFTIVVRSQRPKCLLLGRIPDTDLYKSLKKYDKIEEIPGVKIFRFDTALHFANAELFRDQLYSYINIDFHELRDLIQAEERQKEALENRHLRRFPSISPSSKGRSENQGGILSRVLCPWFETPSTHANGTPRENGGCYGSVGKKLRESVGTAMTVLRPRIQTLALERNPNLPHHIIIDCRGFNYVDVTGVNMLAQVYREMKDINIRVLLANCKTVIRDKFELCEFYAEVPKSSLMLTVQDAVTVAQFRAQEQKESSGANAHVTTTPETDCSIATMF